MINEFFLATGMAVWGFLAALLLWIVLHSFAAVSSFYVCGIYAAFKWHRCRLVKWRRVPIEFMRHWWQMIYEGVPQKISNKQFVWTGIFKCEFAAPQPQEQK